MYTCFFFEEGLSLIDKGGRKVTLTSVGQDNHNALALVLRAEGHLCGSM